MERRILEFAGILRRNGVRVSTAETLDAFRGIRLTGLSDRYALKDTLRAAMVKRSVDLPTYDRLFDSFFSGLSDLLKELAAPTAEAMGESELQDFLENLENIVDSMDPGMSELARALVLMDHGELERMLRELIDSGQARPATGMSTAAATRAAVEALGAGEVTNETGRLLEAAQQAGMSEQQVQDLKDYLNQRTRDLGEMIKGLLELENQQEHQVEQQAKEFNRLLEKSFYYLSPTEIRQMREAIAALARRLRNAMAIRRKRAKRGRLDVKKTLRLSMEFGGVPFRIRYDVRRREKPQVLILCDISDSVRNVSRFMLQFVHNLQDMYSRVRSFVFVADLAEVTGLFKENDIQTAIQSAVTGDVVNVYAHSDFGRAFRIFHRDHLSAVDKRTTVIILGDARNNYNAPNAWVLQDIKAKARQVIWLNPENRSTWGFGDSEMSLYSDHCDMVEECRNLKQLYAVVDHLVLDS